MALTNMVEEIESRLDDIRTAQYLVINADKRQQIAKTIISMFALLEIARIYKALKRFADLQGPICYNDAQL